LEASYWRKYEIRYYGGGATGGNMKLDIIGGSYR
jgi:hypothetical protein